jgi:nucleotide-binding universal stress UspA family protein
MFKKILVPIDESASAKRAALVGLDMAQKYKAELVVISVVPLPEYGGTVGEIAEAKTEGEERFRRPLEELKSQGLLEGIQIRTEILFGHPAETIVKFVHKNDIDLVVVGHKGSSRIKEFLLGNVASRVVHHVPCTVVVVKI